MMGPQNINAEERTIGVESRDEKPGVFHEEHAEHLNKGAQAIAERGNEATDRLVVWNIPRRMKSLLIQIIGMASHLLHSTPLRKEN